MNGKNKNGCKKRKTPEQLQKLEEAYELGMYPPLCEQIILAESLGLTQPQVESWFRCKRFKTKDKHTRHMMDDHSSSVSPSGSGSGSGSSFKMNDKDINGCKKRRARQRKTPYQSKKLKEAFALGADLKEQARLSKSLGLTKRKVQLWFAYKRLKDRRKQTAHGKHMMDDSVDESNHGSPYRYRSESDSSQSNEPLKAAKTIGQIASQQSLPQTLTPTEIESRIEKEVKTRVASHVESLRVEMEEKMEAMNMTLKRDIFGKRDHGSPQSDSSKLNESLVDQVVGGGGDIKNEMINIF